MPTLVLKRLRQQACKLSVLAQKSAFIEQTKYCLHSLIYIYKISWHRARAERVFVNLWQINEDIFNPQTMHSQETVFTIGNGYFGTRGTFEEGYPKAMPATLLFGVFDSIDVGKEELANTPDWLLIKLFVNGE